LKRNKHLNKKNGDKNAKKSRDWVLDKKERQRRQGKTVRPDTKYTGRKRNNAF
jgi:18S rRNA (guanine1575-N7)-methyltransferase